MEKNKLGEQAAKYIALEEDSFFKQEVEVLLRKEDWAELNDRFYTDLDFGTGGLRGLIGGGFNRMNPYIIRRTTQGLANYIKQAKQAGKVQGEASCVIAYDSRRYSDRFALEAACVLAGNGIKTYLFTSLRPTPELSFAVRYLKATAGIVITASHNPATYNGYKVYWDDGAQVLPPHDTGIIEEVRAVSDYTVIPAEEARQKGFLIDIDDKVDQAYFASVKRQALQPEVLKKHGHEVKVVYTPLHGAGAMPLARCLTDLGVEVVFVPEQKEPDGNFPTVPYPNPEEASAMKLALELAKQTNADLVLGTDPDADRLGIAVPAGSPGRQEYTLITGNQLGVLLADYIFGTRRSLGTLPPKAAHVKTIVTTELQRLVVTGYGGLCFDTLTGFKYIAEKIREFEAEAGGPQYLFGTEESYGFLVGTDVRDKDSISAAVLTVEMTLALKSQGKTVLERLNELYHQHGYFQESQVSKNFTGEAGLKQMNALMERFRNDPPRHWGAVTTVLVKDYKAGVTTDLRTGVASKNIDLPSSNVLQFVLSDDTVISVRPSGTEPKIKFYISCCSEPGLPLPQARETVGKKTEALKKQIQGLV